MGEMIDKTKGAAKEAVGKVTGNDSLRREGKLDQFSGDVKGKTEEAKHAVKHAADNFRDHRRNDPAHRRR